MLLGQPPRRFGRAVAAAQFERSVQPLGPLLAGRAHHRSYDNAYI